MKPPTSPSRAETLQGSAQSLLQGLNVSIYRSSHDVIFHIFPYFSTVFHGKPGNQWLPHHFSQILLTIP